MITATATSTGSAERLWLFVSEVELWGDRLPTVTSVHALEPTRAVGVGSRFEVRQPRLAVGRLRDHGVGAGPLVHLGRALTRRRDDRVAHGDGAGGRLRGWTSRSSGPALWHP